MFGLGTGELIIIGIVLFIFIGPKRLPLLGSSIAKGIKNFKTEMKDSALSKDDN